MYFKGIANDKPCEVTLNFLQKINPDKVTCKNLARTTEFVIAKVIVILLIVNYLNLN